MRMDRRIVSFLAALLLLCGSASAASVQNISQEAGQTAVLTFQFPEVYNVDGVFTVGDPQGIAERCEVSVAETGMATAAVSGNRLWVQPSAEPVKTDISVVVQLDLRADAAAGAVCTVSFSGIYGDGNEEPGNEHDIYQAATVTVQAPPPIETPPPVVTTIVVEPPADPAWLEKQIAIAEGLKAGEYTTGSWNAMQSALANAREALDRDDQGEFNAAAAALTDAIAALTRMDYTKLQRALADAAEFTQSEEIAALWQQQTDAVSAGEALLTSGDQAAVDAAAAAIQEMLARNQAALEELQTPKVVEVEVPVEVLPEDDYCNISMHRFWPVLFFASLAVNLVLVILIVSYTIKKKKYQNDDTPLVDYDIGDDF